MRKVHRPVWTRVDGRGKLVELLNTGQWKALLYGRMRRHAVMGHHYHKRTDVVFFLLDGKARVTSVQVRTARRRRCSLGRNQGVVFGSYESHAIRFLAPSEFIMAKSRPYRPSQPDTFAYRVDGA